MTEKKPMLEHGTKAHWRRWPTLLLLGVPARLVRRGRFAMGIAAIGLTVLSLRCGPGSRNDEVATANPKKNAWHAEAARRSQVFKQTEGAQGKRGQNFERLALAFQEIHQGKTVDQAIEFLGPPDFYIKDGAKQVFVYPFSHNSENDNVFLVIAENGVVASVGWNDKVASGIMNNPGLKPYCR